MKAFLDHVEQLKFSSIRVFQGLTERILPASLRLNVRRFYWIALLILPFAITSIFLLATGRQFNAFWGDDEHNFHYPLILKMAQQWPHFDFLYEGCATTPLLHILGATMVTLFRANLPILRDCMTVVSAVAIIYTCQFLCRGRGLSRASSLLGALVLMLSFYFFGYSFLVLTDNLALLFCLLAFGSLYRFLAGETKGMGAYVAGCVWLCLALLSRQSCVYLCVPFALAPLLRPGWLVRQRVIALLVLGLSLAPMIALFVLWKGFVPPAAHLRHTPGGFPFYIHSIAMPLCVLGFYLCFFRAADIWAWLTSGWKRSSAAQLTTAAVIFLISIICSGFLIGDERLYTGILNTVGKLAPHVLGDSIMTWLLLQIGLCATLWALWRHRWFDGSDPGKTIALLSFVALCLVSAANNVATQKYYDAPVLICLLWATRREQSENRHWKFSMLVLIGLFCIYQIVRQSSVWYVT